MTEYTICSNKRRRILKDGNTTQKLMTTSSTEQSKTRGVNTSALLEKCKKSLKIPKG